MGEQRLAQAVSARCRPNVEVLEVDSVPAAKGGEIVEPERESDRFPVPLRDIAEHARLGPEQRLRQPLRRGVDSIGQPLVFRQLTHEIEDQPRVGGTGGSDMGVHAANRFSRGS